MNSDSTTYYFNYSEPSSTENYCVVRKFSYNQNYFKIVTRHELYHQAEASAVQLARGSFSGETYFIVEARAAFRAKSSVVPVEEFNYSDRDYYSHID